MHRSIQIVGFAALLALAPGTVGVTAQQRLVTLNDQQLSELLGRINASIGSFRKWRPESSALPASTQARYSGLGSGLARARPLTSLLLTQPHSVLERHV